MRCGILRHCRLLFKMHQGGRLRIVMARQLGQCSQVLPYSSHQLLHQRLPLPNIPQRHWSQNGQSSIFWKVSAIWWYCWILLTYFCLSSRFCQNKIGSRCWKECCRKIIQWTDRLLLKNIQKGRTYRTLQRLWSICNWYLHLQSLLFRVFIYSILEVTMLVKVSSGDQSKSRRVQAFGRDSCLLSSWHQHHRP